MTRCLVLLAVLLFFCGCNRPQPGMTTRDNVLPAGGDQFVEVTTPMIFYDLTVRQAQTEPDEAKAKPHRAAIRLLAGKYVLEAQDEEYDYFRSPDGVEFAMLDVERVPRKNPVPREVRTVPGGLVFARSNPLKSEAGVFIDGDAATRKVLAWRLGGEFFQRRGIDWNYKP